MMDALPIATRYGTAAQPRWLRLKWLVFTAVLVAPGAAIAGYTRPSVPEPCSAKVALPPNLQLLCASPEVWPAFKANRDLDDRVRANVPDPQAYDRHQEPYSSADFPDCNDGACLAQKFKENDVWLRAQLAAHPSKRQAPPPTPQFTEYTKRMGELREQVALAFVARGCFLRSQDWYRTLGNSYTLTKFKLEKDLAMSQADTSRVESYEAGIEQRVMAAHPLGATTCDGLRNSPAMDRLDALQRQATGGYH